MIRAALLISPPALFAALSQMSIDAYPTAQRCQHKGIDRILGPA